MNQENTDKIRQKNKRKILARRRHAETISNRLGGFFAIVLLAFLILGGNLARISYNNNNDYQRIILSQQSYDSTTLTPKRGDIIDTNGTVLATTKEQYNVILDVKALLSKCESAGDNTPQNATLNALHSVFGADVTAMNSYIMSVPESQYYVVKKGITYEEKTRFEQYTTEPPEEKLAESLYNPNVTGVWFEKHMFVTILRIHWPVML